MRTKGRSASRGSMVVVVGVAVVLGILGGAALVMSTNYHRQDVHEQLRYNAKLVCQAIAEHAALMIHNGSCDLVLDQTLGRPAEIDIPTEALQHATNLGNASNLKISKPRVEVLAAVLDSTGNTRLVRSGKNQWNEIMAEVKSIENPGARQKAIAFWQRMEKEASAVNGTEDVAGTASDEDGQAALKEKDQCFDRLVNSISIDGFAPNYERDDQGRIIRDKSIKPLVAVHNLFKSGKPSPQAFLAAWKPAVEAVGQIAASKVQACGSNPASALAHLVGDMKYNEEVASGTEVEVTNQFLKSRTYGDTTQYLIQLRATMDYGTPQNPRMGKVAHTTYRLFQKALWDKAVDGMAKAMVKSLLKHGMSEDDICTMWPPEGADGNSKTVCPTATPVKAGSTRKYNMKKVFQDLEGVLPASVGSRLYPYTVCAATERPTKN